MSENLILKQRVAKAEKTVAFAKKIFASSSTQSAFFVAFSLNNAFLHLWLSTSEKKIVIGLAILSLITTLASWENIGLRQKQVENLQDKAFKLS